ncbi:MAG TPA: hypothetical protein VMH04_18580 [Candidatus Solibacter sp.]|nr:hypothetical protein [Candidatus Solibacter sp.]
MNDENNEGPNPDLRERIARQIRAMQARRSPMEEEERQKLKSAARRLDQLLEAAANAEAQSLKNAAARLDQFLTDIRKGKDIVGGVKRRKDWIKDS